MKKIICLVIVLLLMSGCTISYRIDINEDLTYNEKIIVGEDDYLFDTTIFEDYSFIKKNYNVKKNTETKYITETYSKKGVKLTDFTSKDVLKKYFGNIVINSKSQTTFKAVPLDTFKKYITPTEFEDAPVTRVKLKIKIPFKVIESNADSVEDDVYVWDITHRNYQRVISVTFDSSKVNKSNNVIFGLFILGIFVLVGIYFVPKIKNLMQF